MGKSEVKKGEVIAPKTIELSLSSEEKLRLENIALKQANAQNFIENLRTENEDVMNDICKRLGNSRDKLVTLNYMSGVAVFNKEK